MKQILNYNTNMACNEKPYYKHSNQNNMEIKHQAEGNRGTFYIEQAGSQVAAMTYVWSGEHRFIIDHTEVGDSLRGSGAGKKLVEAGVQFAREKGVKILPLCPFAKKVMEGNPDYADVLF
jgi:uncharacterized protein